MKVYKLINKTTGEETICTKVVIDGFDYYVSDKIIGEDGLFVMGNELIYNSSLITNEWCKSPQPKPIATNNSFIDIGQVTDKDNIDFSLENQGYFEDDIFNRTKPVNEIRIIDYNNGLIEGYNKHAETHTLSNDEVLEFGLFCAIHACSDEHTEDVSRKELLQLFKEQQIKTIYYD